VLFAVGGMSLAAAAFMGAASFRGSGDLKLRRLFAAAFAVGGAALLALGAMRGGKDRSAASSSKKVSRRGVTLVAVLAIGAALSALALLALSSAQRDMARARSLLRSRRLAALAADEAVRRLRQLADDDDSAVDHLEEDWAKPAVRQWADGTRLESRVEDENRRLDLNLLARVGKDAVPDAISQAAAELLVRCGAGDPGQRLANLRAAFYPSTPGVFEGKTGPVPLRNWADLSEVPGFSRDFLDQNLTDRPRLGDVFTVAPFADGRPVVVNVNTAAPEVLSALFGMSSAGAVRALLSLREAAPLRSLEPAALTADPVAFDRLRPFLDVRSDLFRVEARAEEVGMERDVRVLARREVDGRVRVLEWTER